MSLLWIGKLDGTWNGNWDEAWDEYSSLQLKLGIEDCMVNDS